MAEGRPRVGEERVVRRTVIGGFAGFVGGLEKSVGLRAVVRGSGGKVVDGENGGRGGLSRLVRDLQTRSWAAWGEEARTRQIMWVGEEAEVRSWWRMWAPRAPVAPVRIWVMLSGSSERRFPCLRSC